MYQSLAKINIGEFTEDGFNSLDKTLTKIKTPIDCICGCLLIQAKTWARDQAFHILHLCIQESYHAYKNADANEIQNMDGKCTRYRSIGNLLHE